MIRILIADDHPVVRNGMRQLLSMVGDFLVAGEASNGAEVLTLLQQQKFDLLLLDMNMPGISGVELISAIRASHAGLPILVQSMHNEAQIAARAIRAGASGYLTKDNDPETVMSAIRQVSEGKIYIDPLLASRVTL